MLSAQASVLITARLRSVNAEWVLRLVKLYRVAAHTGASQSERGTRCARCEAEDLEQLGMLGMRMQGACIHGRKTRWVD